MVGFVFLWQACKMAWHVPERLEEEEATGVPPGLCPPREEEEREEYVHLLRQDLHEMQEALDGMRQRLFPDKK